MDAAGGRVAGRTAMQKLAYFASIHLGVALGHRAYYYGPYSSRVEDALANAVIAGELSQETKRLRGRQDGPDIVLYTYTLKPEGQRRAEELKVRFPHDWEEIAHAVTTIKEIIPDFDQKLLSSAAKTYLIVSDSEGGEVDEAEIPDLAKRLGWALTSGQVKRTIDLLEKLGLVAGDEGEDESGADKHPHQPAGAR